MLWLRYKLGKAGPGACFRVLKSLGRARLSGMTVDELQNDTDFPAYLTGYIAPAMLADLIGQGTGSGATLAFMSARSISCVPMMAAV